MNSINIADGAASGSSFVHRREPIRMRDGTGQKRAGRPQRKDDEQWAG